MKTSTRNQSPVRRTHSFGTNTINGSTPPPRRTVSFNGTTSRQAGLGLSNLLVGGALLSLTFLSIYQSQYCSLIQNAPLLPPDDAPFRRLPNDSSPSADDDSTTTGNKDNNDKSLDEPQPELNIPEDQAISELQPQPQQVEEEEEEPSKPTKRRRRHRIQQVNATIVTDPTIIADAGDSRCTLQTKPLHAKTLARFFVFQRDGRQQLRDFVQHYTRVLPYNSLVILNHQGTDPYTQSLLQDYGRRGAHIWTCTGSFKGKAAMWTKVIRTYAADSGFVFPVDIDELLAVKKVVVVNDNNDNTTSLQWNLPAFKDALYKLGRSGKPFKMNWIESVPGECHHVHLKKKKKQQSTTTSPSDDDDNNGGYYYASDMCDIRYVKPKDIGCMDKTFSRGIHFHKTDTGNHYGGTRQYPKLTKKVCEDKGLENVYEISTLALVHLKEKTFEDWLVHGLRGATDRGFHTDYNIDCNHVQQSLHYCRKWEKITQAKFSPYELRKVYIQDVCPDPDIELMTVGDTFCERAEW